MVLCLLLSPHASAAPIASATIDVFDIGVDIDTRTDLPGVQNTLTAIRDVPSVVFARVGAANATFAPVLPAGVRVRASLVGPQFPTGVALSTAPNMLLDLPGIRIPGEYALIDVRAELADGTLYLQRDPSLDAILITVIDELLVSQVTSRPLSAQEIQEKGIVIDEDNFSAVNFTVGLTLGSEQVQIELPVALPTNPNAQLEAPPVLPTSSLSGSTAAGFETVKIPNLSVSGFSLRPFDAELPPGVSVPPVNGVVVIPGNIAFLNQFFSVVLITTNQAPDGSGLDVQLARARITLPPGKDAIEDTGDDPLRLATVVGGGNEADQPLVDPTGSDTILPQGTNEAEYLVEGLREGTHRVDFEISGELTVPGLDEPVAIMGKAAGVVQVRNPTFHVVLAHPQVVRAEEEYSLFATVTNTSSSPANFFQLSLGSQSLSGARLADAEDPRRVLSTLLPNDSATFEYRLVAQRTGEVTGTVALADPGVNGSFVLTTGVGARGIPLSPDTLVLPQTTDFLPDDLVTASVRLLGQAYSVATAPSGTLPSGVDRISRETVVNRAVRLAQSGLHVRFSEPEDIAAGLLLADYVAADLGRLDDLFADPATREATRTNLEAWDTLRRTTPAGSAFADAVGGVVAGTLAGQSLQNFQRVLAERLASRAPHLSFAVQTDGGTIYPLIDTSTGTLGRIAGTNPVERSLRTGARLPLSGPGGFAEMLFVGAAGSEPYLLEFFLSEAASTRVSLIVPSAMGLLEVTYPETALPGGAFGMISVDADPTGPLILDIDSNGDGICDIVLTPTIVPIVDPAPTLVGALSWGKGARPIRPLEFATGDPLGRLVGVLFSEEIRPPASGFETFFSVPAHVAVSALPQPDKRLVFVQLDRPVGPFLPRDVTVTDVEDRKGNATGAVALTIGPDPDRGVGGRVQGVVRRADGQPVPFARIRYVQPVFCPACEFQAGRADDLVISTFNTDAFGRYGLDFVLQNAWRADTPDIFLSGGPGPGTRNFKLEATDPQTGDVGRTSTRIVSDGQRLNLDIIIRGFGSIVGNVFLAGSTPEDRIPLFGGPPNSSSTLFVVAENLSTGESAVAWVDSQGRYAFPRQFIASDGTDLSAPRLPVGNIVLRAVSTEEIAQGVVTANIPRDGAVVERDLVLFPANQFGTVTGRVLEADGATPASAVFVQLAALDAVGLSPIATQNTDETGSFTFPDVPAGDVELLAFRQETFEQIRGATFLGAGQTKDVTLVLPGSGGTVRGIVVDSLGNLVPGATVAGGPTLTNTDSLGFFEITGLPLGTYTITAQGPEGGAIGGARVTVPTPDTVQEIVIGLEAVGTVTGTVFRADETTPVAGQEVQLWVSGANGGLIGSTFTSADGTYAFRDFPVKDYQVRAVTEDFGDGGSTDTRVRFAGDIRDVDVFFRGLGRVSGRVIQSDGTPIIANVVLTRKVWRVFTSRSDEDLETIDRLEALRGEDAAQDQAIDAFLNQFVSPEIRYFVLRDEPVVVPNNALGPGGEVLGAFDFEGSITGGPFRLDVFGALVSPTVVPGTIPRSLTAEGREVDVGDIILEPSVGQLMGTVHMPDGITPVGANVAVRLVSVSSNGSVVGPGGPVLPEINATTDENGQFVFPLAIAGLASLTADTGTPSSPATSPETVRTDTFEDIDGNRLLNVRLFGSANAVVPAGDMVVTNIRLRDAGSVRVSVVENDGATPVPNAEVTLRTATALDADIDAGFVRVTANGSGQIDFFPVIAGGYSLLARNTSTFAVGTATGTLPGAMADGFIQTKTITLGAVTTDTDEVVQASEFGTVEGVVMRANGTLVDNPTEVVVRAKGSRFVTTSNITGFFQVTDVPAGSFSVEVFEPLTARRGSASGRLVGEGDVAMVEVTLQGLGTVNGTVFENDGSAPVAGASVSLAPAGDFSAPLIALSSELGTFQFPGVPVGPYTIEAQESFSGTRGEATGDINSDNDVQTTDVLMSPFGTVTGTVFVAGTELVGEVPTNPAAATVAGATVTFSGGGLRRTVQTDSNGRFDSGPFLPVRNYTVTVRAPSPVEDGARRSVALTEHRETRDVAFALAGQGTVAGVVLDSAGSAPVGSAEVVLSSSSRFATGDKSRISAPDGSFEFTEIPVGDFALTVVASTLVPPLGASASGTLTGNGSRVNFVDGDADAVHNAIRLEESGVLRGSVLLSDGTTPAEGALVEVTGGELRLVITTSADGSFELAALPLEDYRIDITEPESNGVAVAFASLVVNGDVVDLGPITVDSERPTVIATTPVANAADVNPGASVVVTFSERLAPSTVTNASFVVSRNGTPISGTLALNPGGDAVTFTPDAPLPDRARIAATVRGDTLDFDGSVLSPGIRDVAGLSLQPNVTFEFTIADTTAPTLASAFPAQGATEIALDTVVRFQLSEAITPSSVSAVTLTNLTTSTAVTGTVATILGNTVVVFTPTLPLQPDASYRAQLLGPLLDATGNAGPAVAADVTFATIDTQAPTLATLNVSPSTFVTGGTALLSATPTDPADTARVEFLVEGAVAASDLQQPFDYTLFLEPALGSEVTVSARAVDAAGNVGPALLQTLSIAPNAPPQVQLLAPVDAEVISGETVIVTIGATDDGGVSQVSYTAGGGVVANGVRAVTPPSLDVQETFSFVVPSDIGVGEQIVVEAAAQDAAGLGSTPDAASVAVLTVADSTPPGVSISSPADGALFEPGSSVDVFIQATDASGVSAITVTASGLISTTVTQTISPTLENAAAQFTFIIPPTAGSNETLQLQASAEDTAGNIGSANATVGVADLVPPAISLALVGGGTVVDVGSTITIVVTASDDVALTTLRVSSDAPFFEERTLSPSQPDAIETFEIAVPASAPLGSTLTVAGDAIDASGNTATATPLLLTVDDLPEPQFVQVVSASRTDIQGLSSGGTSEVERVVLDGDQFVTDNRYLVLWRAVVDTASDSAVRTALRFNGAEPSADTTRSELAGRAQMPAGFVVWTGTQGHDIALYSRVLATGPFSATANTADEQVLAINLDDGLQEGFDWFLEVDSGNELPPANYETTPRTPVLNFIPDGVSDYVVLGHLSYRDTAGAANEGAQQRLWDATDAITLQENGNGAGRERNQYFLMATLQAPPATQRRIELQYRGAPVNTQEKGHGQIFVLRANTFKQVALLPTEDLNRTAAAPLETPESVGALSVIPDTAGDVMVLGDFTVRTLADFNGDPDDANYWLDVTYAGEPFAPMAGISALPTRRALSPFPQVGFSDAFIPSASFAMASGKAAPATVEAFVTTRTFLGTTFRRRSMVAFGRELAPPPFNPSVLSISPPDGSTDVNPSATLQITFTQPIDPATITPSSIQLLDGAGLPVTATRFIAADNSSVEILPALPLADGETFTLRVTAQVQKPNGAPLSPERESQFSTATLDFDPPTVTLISPGDGATNVSPSTPIIVDFSEPVQASTVTAASVQVSASGASIAGTLTLSSDRSRVTFAPGVALALDEVHSVLLSASILDDAGNGLTPFASSFRTSDTNRPDADSDGVSDETELALGTDPNTPEVFADLDLAFDAQTVTLDEPITLRSLTLTGGAVLTHPGATTTRVSQVHLTLQDLIIDATSFIDVTGRGFLGGRQGDNTGAQGRTLGNQPNTAACSSGLIPGGSHAGAGYDLSTCSGNLGYGDMRNPTLPGSGGDSGSSTWSGGNGGGVIRIQADQIVVDGGILADASLPSGTGATVLGGGGAGGSVLIETRILGGTGIIAARGSTLEVTSASGGSGGRVAVYYDALQGFDITSGLDASGGVIGRPGSVGTAFSQASSEQFGRLDISSGRNVGPLTLRSAGTGSITALTANVLTAAGAAFPLPDDATGDPGLRGHFIRPDITGDRVFRIVDNTATTLTVDDQAEGSLLDVAAPGATYIGVYAFDALETVGDANVPTLRVFCADELQVESTDFILWGREMHFGAFRSETLETIQIAGRFTADSIALGEFRAQALRSFQASTAALALSGTINASDQITIDTGAVLTHPPATNSRDFRLEFTTAGAFLVDSQSSIDVSGKGYRGAHLDDNTSSRGRSLGRVLTGFLVLNSTVGEGGSYGGQGGLPSGTNSGTRAYLDAIYGDFRNPNENGSGGSTNDGVGAAGGGLVRVTANTVQLDGTIDADGGPGNSGGGGSGGGILIRAADVSGVGSLSANGSPANTSGGGGGGRIAVIGTGTLGIALSQIQARGGTSQSSVTGGAGTIYLESPSQPAGYLIVDNQGVSGAETPLVGIGAGTFSSIEATVLTDTAASFPLPIPNRGYLGLQGLELDIGAPSTFTVLDNTTTELVTDPADGDMTLLVPGGSTSYVGVYTLTDLLVAGAARVRTVDNLVVTNPVTVSGGATLDSNNLDLP